MFIIILLKIQPFAKSTRRVLSKTKAIMSPPMSLDGINFFVEEVVMKS